MLIGTFGYYLIIINVVGFAAFIINMLLYNYTRGGQIDVILTIVSLLGGSAGIVAAILIFDRKAEKDNMMSRIFVACIFVIQIVILLIIKGHLADNITLAFWKFLDSHRILLMYLVLINMVTFAAFAVDKIAAIKQKPRIRIVTLLSLSFAGGSIGALIAMYLLRHKIRKDYFTVGVPLTLVMQMVVIFFLMNMK